jgi:hypothetical protein
MTTTSPLVDGDGDMLEEAVVNASFVEAAVALASRASVEACFSSRRRAMARMRP